jgi:alkylhydroperoxidase family enzyme
LSDSRIAALDGDWAEYTTAERAAFALGRKLTDQPHRVTAADIDRLRRHYKDLQILEMLFTVANNNATNRWTDALGIPQEEDSTALSRAMGKSRKKYPTFLTPTAARYADRPSQIAPTQGAGPGRRSPDAVLDRRPPLETRAQVEEALAACRTRAPRFPLVEEGQARTVLPEGWPKSPLPQWVRLLAHFPKAGTARIRVLRAAREKGHLPPRLKAQVAWIAARHDRAWYALGRARRDLLDLGLSEDSIYALDGSWKEHSSSERAAFRLVRKLTVEPDWIGDEDIAEVRKHYRDREVAELIYLVANAAFFNRITEAAGLRLEAR